MASLLNMSGGLLDTFEKPYVDLGLPSGTLWARGNLVKDAQGNYSIGNPEEGNTYFSWGNIDGYNSSEVGTGTGQYSFTSANYALTDGSQVTDNIASNDAVHDAAINTLTTVEEVEAYNYTTDYPERLSFII